MTGSGIVVTVEGLDQLTRKLRGVTEPIGGIVREAGIFAREKTATYAKPHAADTGALGQKITLKLGAGVVPLEATIAPNRAVAGLAWKVEVGQGPGKAPPTKAIGRWGKRHGYLSRTITPWILAQKIAREGTRGVHMFEHAAKDTEAKVKELIGNAVRTIERKWGS